MEALSLRVESSVTLVWASCSETLIWQTRQLATGNLAEVLIGSCKPHTLSNFCQLLSREERELGHSALLRVTPLAVEVRWG